MCLIFQPRPFHDSCKTWMGKYFFLPLEVYRVCIEKMKTKIQSCLFRKSLFVKVNLQLVSSFQYSCKPQWKGREGLQQTLQGNWGRKTKWPVESYKVAIGLETRSEFHSLNSPMGCKPEKTKRMNFTASLSTPMDSSFLPFLKSTERSRARAKQMVQRTVFNQHFYLTLWIISWNNLSND